VVLKNLARKLVYLVMLDKEIHVHVHTDNCEILSILKEIRDILKESNDEKLKSEIMDKLNRIKTDVESTIS